MRKVAGLGILLAVAGIVAVILAADVRSWHDATQGTAVRASAAPARAIRLQASTTLPSGVSEEILGIQHDRRWLEAVQRFTVAYRDTLGANELVRSDYVLLNRGEAALEKVTQDPDPARASRAFNLLAVLVFRAAVPGTGPSDITLIQRSVTDLQHAVQLDASDEQAKANLELALRALIAVNTIQQGQASGTTPTNKPQGAYGGPPGEGY